MLIVQLPVDQSQETLLKSVSLVPLTPPGTHWEPCLCRLLWWQIQRERADLPERIDSDPLQNHVHTALQRQPAQNTASLLHAQLVGLGLFSDHDWEGEQVTKQLNRISTISDQLRVLSKAQNVFVDIKELEPGILENFSEPP